MSNANLPTAVVQHLADRGMRVHHNRWHFIRARWNELEEEERQFYMEIGWEPPRLVGETGAGLDFLYMHRRMIEQVNHLLAHIADPTYLRVVGWGPIPWDHDDPIWPMPLVFLSNPAKTQARTDFFRQEVQDKYENNTWLQSVNLDLLGTQIENSIHNWMHIHWTDAPWYTGDPLQDINDTRHDWLADTYSSHVNKAFWKLHGWIDDRITQWEQANGQVADFSDSWEGPVHAHVHHGVEATIGEESLLATLAPLTQAEAEFAKTMFFDASLEDTV